MSERLPAVERNPEEPATSAVIWMHGLGADGHDFEDIVPMLRLSRTRFVFPHALVRPVTINGGMPMRAWYDIISMDFSDRRVRTEDIDESAAQIRAWIEHERSRGVPCERIFLAGFSQGAAMALHVGLRFPERLGGIVALSGYLLQPERLATEGARAQRHTPVLMCHGLADSVVPHALGATSWTRVEAWSEGEVQWHEFPIGHQVSVPEIETLGAWLRSRAGGVEPSVSL